MVAYRNPMSWQISRTINNITLGKPLRFQSRWCLEWTMQLTLLCWGEEVSLQAWTSMCKYQCPNFRYPVKTDKLSPGLSIFGNNLQQKRYLLKKVGWSDRHIERPLVSVDRLPNALTNQESKDPMFDCDVPWTNLELFQKLPARNQPC